MAEEHSFQSCLNAAYRYLSYRPRSEMEIKTRLRKRAFDDRSIEKTIEGLKERGLVDDLAFARFWIDNRESFSPRGRAMLRKELREKGVAPGIIDEVAGGIDEESSAYRAAQKRLRTLASVDYKDFHDRIGIFLRRRGFSYTIVNSTINQLWHEMEGKDG